MYQLNGYLGTLWDSLVTNFYGVYYYFISFKNMDYYSSADNTNTDTNTDSVVQMNNFIPIKNINEYREELEFIIGKEIKKDISEDELLNYINSEINYVNKKMSMTRSVSQINVDDIVLKTKLLNLRQNMRMRDFYVEEITEIINY